MNYVKKQVRRKSGTDLKVEQRLYSQFVYYNITYVLLPKYPVSLATHDQLAIQFSDEFKEICNYISNQLNNVNASNRLRVKVIYNVLLLEKIPKICSEIEKTDKTKRQYRRMVVNNYVILYTIDEIEKIVYVAHIYYGGRNYLK